MADTASRILLFAVIAAASPVALLATTAVLTSRRGRTNGTVYLVGFFVLMWNLAKTIRGGKPADATVTRTGTKVVGNINMALVVGLLQFVTTFLLAYLYSSYSNRNLDPLAREPDPSAPPPPPVQVPPQIDIPVPVPQLQPVPVPDPPPDNTRITPDPLPADPCHNPCPDIRDTPKPVEPAPGEPAPPPAAPGGGSANGSGSRCPEPTSGARVSGTRPMSSRASALRQSEDASTPCSAASRPA